LFNIPLIFLLTLFQIPMNEEILSFIWRFQYFETPNLKTDEDETLSVTRTGYRNTNSGPDFSEARVIINGVDWAGSVEIHVRSSDWFQHAHEVDPTYENVVLHVVWENDRPVIRADGTVLPTLSLRGLVRRSVLDRYDQLLHVGDEIPCSNSFEQVQELQKFAMLDRVLLERLDKKSSQVIALLSDNHQDWEETAYQWLCQHFGFKLNDPAFLKLSQNLPLRIIRKHKDNLLQIEALLFGCAGLIPDNLETETLDNPADEQLYVQELRREYQFLASKYVLRHSQMAFHEWKFLRLRPAGFPTIRMAQLAVLLSKSSGIFYELTSAQSISQLHQLLDLRQSAYWINHFHFEKTAKSKVPAMGKDAGNLLIINAVVPLMVAYSKQRQLPAMLDKAISWLSALPAENNRITREWEKLGMKVKTSSDSQALIEWYHSYCTPRRCLDCTVGASLIRSV
jgi:hypothetical protein